MPIRPFQNRSQQLQTDPEALVRAFSSVARASFPRLTVGNARARGRGRFSPRFSRPVGGRCWRAKSQRPALPKITGRGLTNRGAPKVGANLALAHLACEQQAPSLASTFPQFFLLQIDHCIWLMWRSVGWPWCDRSFVEFQCRPVSESLLLSKLRRSCALNLPKLDLSIFGNHPWI